MPVHGYCQFYQYDPPLAPPALKPLQNNVRIFGTCKNYVSNPIQFHLELRTFCVLLLVGIQKSGKIIAFLSIGLDILPSDTPIQIQKFFHKSYCKISSACLISDLGQLMRGPGHMLDQSQFYHCISFLSIPPISHAT